MVLLWRASVALPKVQTGCKLLYSLEHGEPYWTPAKAAFSADARPGTARGRLGPSLNAASATGSHHPIRRCNLSCTYCNEFDNFSKPVALEEMFHRVDLLARARHHDHYHQRRRAAAASAFGGSRPAHSATRHSGGLDYQRLPADAAAHRAPEPRGPGPLADFHRQRRSPTRFPRKA